MVVGSIKEECLTGMIPLGENHLRRVHLSQAERERDKRGRE